VDNYAMSDDEKDWLSTYAKLEYFDPQTKAWQSMADEVGNGLYFGETSLGPKETVAIKLRVDITAKAPAGDGFSMGIGGYVDEEKNCVHSAFGFYEFTVLKPGSSNPDPGEAKPGKGTKPAGGKEPQGGATELEPTGSLAHTGSSSALPVIGLVGGAAVVVGAGAVFVVRRRNGSGSGAAA
jgi:LPXTG-motif cell wall-anchored protein